MNERLFVKPLDHDLVGRVDGGLPQHAGAGIDEGVWSVGGNEHEIAYAGLDRCAGNGVARLALVQHEECFYAGRAREFFGVLILAADPLTK